MFATALLLDPVAVAVMFAFFFPIFLPALVAAVLGLTAPAHPSRLRQIVISVLLLPAFALAGWLSYSYTTEPADVTTSNGIVTAYLVVGFAATGALAAAAAIADAAFMRRDGLRWSWPWAIAAGNIGVLLVAGWVTVPG